MRLYIAGPMTGLPDLNYPAFNAEAERLRSFGYEVENPAENPEPPCGSWQGYMRLGITQLMTCDAVVMLPNWHESKGARCEAMISRLLGIPIHPPENIYPPISSDTRNTD